MQFVVNKQNLQKELGFVQGVVEKKNTIPVLSNILIESDGENTIRITGTDLDVTIRCDMDAEEITTPGSMCVQARKLFEIARLLPDAPVSFKKEDNDWVKACQNFVVPGKVGVGRKRRTWKECVEKDMKSKGLTVEDAQDRVIWRWRLLGKRPTHASVE